MALLLQGVGRSALIRPASIKVWPEANIVDWIAGISIGAINAAIIAGNPPERRIDRLREFWERITDHPWSGYVDQVAPFINHDMDMHSFFNQASAAQTVVGGVPGFFRPRVPPPFLYPPATLGITSYYDTKPLRATLERLIDFDRLNTGKPRFSVGASQHPDWQCRVFSTNTVQKIGPITSWRAGRCRLASRPSRSTASSYWDGGLVSNTPLLLGDGVRHAPRPGSSFRSI